MKAVIPFLFLTVLLGFAAEVDAKTGAAATPAAVPTAPAEAEAAATSAPAPREPLALHGDEPGCCEGEGGPDGTDGLDLSRIDFLLDSPADDGRWRLPDDRAEARRFLPAEPRYNSITIPF